MPLDAADVSESEGVKVKVAVHLMEAKLGFKDDVAREEYRKQHNDIPQHFLAPIAGAVSTGWLPALAKFFGREGTVSKIWSRHDIQLSLVAAERCKYDPALLRLEDATDTTPCTHGGRACRDSIFFPDQMRVGAVSWAGQVFRDVNKLFTREEPDVLHVLAWWTLGETAPAMNTNLPILGYGRAAGRGGAVAWVYTLNCTDHCDMYDTCALVLAHEIGHAFGLHHVQHGDVNDEHGNMMNPGSPSGELAWWQGEHARQEARQFNSRVRGGTPWERGRGL